MNFIPLTIKTDYSMLKSLVSIPKLILKCKEYGYKSIGIADENMFGIMDFYKECTKNDIKPIVGLEVKINDYKILLYAKNYIGYQNLCYIYSNEKTIDLIKENSKELIIILPFESLSLYDKLSSSFEDIYIGYNTLEQREEIKNKKCIYINEVLCLEENDINYLKYLSMIKDGTKLKDSENYTFKKDCYLLKEEEVLEKINKLDYINYKVINESINLKIETRSDLLPKYNEDSNFDDYKFLTDLCKKGLLKRLNNKVPMKYADRLMYELEIISKMGFCNYFLIVWDFVKYSKQNKIFVGPGRGSAVGSLVSYSLGITDIDPLKYNLFFERFLNPERVTMPDIDIDFDSLRKNEVISYVAKKYGQKNVAGIITFSTLKSKQVLRDVFRIFDYDQYKVDKFVKLIDSKLSLKENKNNRAVLEELSKDTLLSRIYDISIHLEGLKRQPSINAAGVIISSKELDRYIPIYKVNDTDIVTGYTKNYLEDLGLLKMDFLSIDNLTLTSKLLDEIKTINFNEIPLDDEKTIDLLKKANTEGIFQLESSGMKNVLKKFHINNFDDLVALIALFRPGPMENIDSYIRRKDGKEKITYIHDDLKEILESTYGIIIYQEQIMQIANKMADYTLGEADVLRRAMGKKSLEIMENERQKFISRSINKGYSEKVSTEVFELIYKFADFGFNKSHSIGYATLAFKMAYIKAHYPNYFLRHLLSLNIGKDSKTKEYVNEAKNNNIEILHPDINKSDYEYKVDGNNIRFSLCSIHEIGPVLAKNILIERENGEFTSFLDFVKRCYNKGINKRSLEYLINAGAFDSFEYNHKTLIENLDVSINYAELAKDLDESLITKPEFVIYDEYTKDELIQKEYETFGFYLSYHPVQKYRKNKLTTNNIKENFNKVINIYLLIEKIKEIKTKNNEKMAFVFTSDEFNEIELVMFPKVYEKFYMINKGDVVLVTAKVEKRVNEYQLIVNNIVREQK